MAIAFRYFNLKSDCTEEWLEEIWLVFFKADGIKHPCAASSISLNKTTPYDDYKVSQIFDGRESTLAGSRLESYIGLGEHKIFDQNVRLIRDGSKTIGDVVAGQDLKLGLTAFVTGSSVKGMPDELRERESDIIFLAHDEHVFRYDPKSNTEVMLALRECMCVTYDGKRENVEMARSGDIGEIEANYPNDGELAFAHPSITFGGVEDEEVPSHADKNPVDKRGPIIVFGGVEDADSD